MQETWVRENLLEKGKATHFSILGLLFPGGSVGKESACNAGELDLIPGLGRSPREGFTGGCPPPPLSEKELT